MSAGPQTVAFFGATGGCALAALRLALESGTRCIALCRTPSKLANLLTPPAPASNCPWEQAPPPPSDEQVLAAVMARYPNLVIKTGNAHDEAAVSSCLVHGGGLVDAVLSGVGGRFVMSRMSLDDPHVCATAMSVLLSSLRALSKQGVPGNPRIVVLSTLGTEGSQRGYPIVLMPLYDVMLKVPHQDKGEMERLLRQSGARWTIVRPSLLSDEVEQADKPKPVKWEVDEEDGKCTQKGWTIGRDAVGRWVWERVLSTGEFEQKIVSITH